MAKLMKDFVRIENDFTIVPNDILRNKEMKSSTKNILLTMIGLPPDWDFSIAGIATCVYEGRETVQKALVELEKMGYITRKRNRREDGTLGAMMYTIHQFPVSEDKKTYKKNFSDQDVKKPKQVKTNIGKNQNREKPVLDSKTQLRTNNKLSINFKLSNDFEQKNLKENKIEKVDTLHKSNAEVDTTALKKQLPMGTQKRTREELEELQSDMIRRFYETGQQYDVDEIVFENVIGAFKRYLARYTQRTGKIHPILKGETLENIFVTLATITDNRYSHFENAADCIPGSGESTYLDDMVDEHFRADHRSDTDWHISHFANREYLEKIAQHIVEY